MRGASSLQPAILMALLVPWAAYGASPSFDCTKAQSSAEALVCADEELAKLDREVARLFVLARDGARTRSSRVTELTGTQRGWMRTRDNCWKEPDARVCVLRSYAARIHELREGYAGARAEAAGGISSGPVAVDCQRMSAPLSATFIRTNPALVHIKAPNMYPLVMTTTPAASGARYTSTYEAGQAVFWDKGGDAVLTYPGGREFNCRIRRPR